MKNYSIFLVLLLAVSIATGNSIAADFYVSGNGSDSCSGKLPQPKGEDGPFATSTRARDAVRELKAQAGAKDINVQIRAGQYRLGVPIDVTKIGLREIAELPK